MKNFLKNPWILGIGTTVVGGVVLSIVLDLIKNISILSTMKNVLIFIWNCIVAILNFNIKVWWLLIAIAVLVGVLWIVAKIQNSKEESNVPSFLNYTQDYLAGYSWEWTWEKNWEGKYGVENLHPVCTKCKTPLMSSGFYGNQLKCPRCNSTISFDSSISDEVMVLIYDNAKRNYSN